MTVFTSDMVTGSGVRTSVRVVSSVRVLWLLSAAVRHSRCETSDAENERAETEDRLRSGTAEKKAKQSPDSRSKSRHQSKWFQSPVQCLAIQGSGGVQFMCWSLFVVVRCQYQAGLRKTVSIPSKRFSRGRSYYACSSNARDVVDMKEAGMQNTMANHADHSVSGTPLDFSFRDCSSHDYGAEQGSFVPNQ